MAQSGHIVLRGVRVHNLQAVDLDIPRRKLIVLCGLSGSGKSSLAVDTLFTEGQRRYLESFSAYTRQFLERLEKPDADRIEGIPPAIAVTGKQVTRSSRSTVGTATETVDYLRLLFAKVGQVVCRGCGQPVRCDSADSIAALLGRLPEGARLMITFRVLPPENGDSASLVNWLREEGFVRVIVGDSTINLDDSASVAALGRSGCPDHWYVVVDRLTAGTASASRLRESLELALGRQEGRCYVFVETEAAEALGAANGAPQRIDGRSWHRKGFSSRLACEDCGLEYPAPEPRLYSFNSPLGACPACEGFGNVIDVDMDLVVPDRSKSIRQGAIAPWNTPAYAHELEELLELAEDYKLPVDAPFDQLRPEHLELIVNGVPERNFGGLRGFFAWLERRKYKMHIRVFLSRWRSYRPCASCGGTRLRAEALCTRVGGKNIAEVCALQISRCLEFFRSLSLEPWQQRVARVVLDQLVARLAFLEKVGLGYLTLDRMLRTLSGGEARRVALTAALGSNLVNMLYVLDEPSVGLHPRDVDRLVDAIMGLRNRGNTVVVVEHEEAVIRAADQVIEIGPGAGGRGGRIVFQGTPEELQREVGSLTGDFLARRRGISSPSRRRQPEHGWIRLTGARGNNLKNITVEFPLGVLCLVTGVSGSGKSSLVHDTLYPALCRRLRKDAPKPLEHDDLFGDGQVDDVILVDQSPIARSARSNPVTYLKAFDEIRAVFAQTPEAKRRNLTPSHFSFNVDGGRCPTCQGEGFLQVDMQFLADVYIRCPQCGGARYRKDILDVTYRGRDISQVLDMTVREAFTFFRGRPKVQTRLKRLIDVGLEYVRLGQPVGTLSAGEAQRLKLAGYMSAAKRGRCLFLLDEPTTGLHYADIVQLLDCFDALLAVGHSLIVVEHNLQVMKAADYIVDLGPGAADQGGQIVVQGTPEKVANTPESITGRFLVQVLQEYAPAQQ